MLDLQPERITFTYTRGNDEILMTMDCTGKPHMAITEVYVQFLKAMGFSLSEDLVSYDINDLAYDS